MKFETNNRQSHDHISKRALESLQLRKVANPPPSTLDSHVMEQFNYLNTITCNELSQEEQPFLGISASEEPNYKYEVTIALNSPNLFLYVDVNGSFVIEGHSSWCSPTTMHGHNKELVNYLDQITGE